MSVKRPKCECCQRVRKPSLKVRRCQRCRKYICPNANCQVPHVAGACGDQFANAKARAEANAGPPRTFKPEDAFDPRVLVPDVPTEHGEVFSKEVIEEAVVSFRRVGRKC